MWRGADICRGAPAWLSNWLFRELLICYFLIFVSSIVCSNCLCPQYFEVYRRLARHSLRAEANYAIQYNTVPCNTIYKVIKVAPKKGFWPFSLAVWFYMDRNNAVWSGHIVAPLWIPHLPIFEKKIDPGPLKVAVRPLSGPFSGHRAGFWPENPFFAIGSRISSMARL